MVKIYHKLHKMMSVLQYFVLREWEWKHGNVDALRDKLVPGDHLTFYFDPKAIHWPTYTENYCLGTKMYLLKEDLTGLPAARAHMKKYVLLSFYSKNICWLISIHFSLYGL